MITRSSRAAILRYREKSSFISAIATLLGPRCLFFEPTCGRRFVDDRKDLGSVFLDVIEHPHFSDSKPVLRSRKAVEALDAASADAVRLVPQMPFDRILDSRPSVRPQCPQLANSARVPSKSGFMSLITRPSSVRTLASVCPLTQAFQKNHSPPPPMPAAGGPGHDPGEDRGGCEGA